MPPKKDAGISGDSVFANRDAHIEPIGEVARQMEAGQHTQARAENTLFRHKRLFDGWLRARDERAQKNEVGVG